MKVDVTKILLIVACAVLLWLKFCNAPVETESPIQVTSTETIPSPQPVSTEKPTIKEVIRIVYRWRDKALNFDSLKTAWSSLPDTIRVAKEDSLVRTFSDSCFIKRVYNFQRVDSFNTRAGKIILTSMIKERVLGWSDSLTMSHQLQITPPSQKALFSVGAMGGSDKTFAPAIMYQSSNKYAYIASYGLTNKSVNVGIFIPINK